MDSNRKAAVIHALKGILKDEDVPVGSYELGGVKVTITLPDDAQVVRESGTEGNGFDAGTKELSMPPAAMALMLHSMQPAPTKASWKKLIKTVIREGVVPDDHLPPNARAALKDLNREMAAELRTLKKTAAKRLNVKSAVVELHDVGQLAVYA